MKEKLFYMGAGFLACLLLTFLFGRWTPVDYAYAQAPAAGRTTVALGDLHRGLLPIVVVDSADDSILLYEADLTRTAWRLELKNARTYRYDKQLREYPPEGAGRPSPPIDRVREFLGRETGR